MDRDRQISREASAYAIAAGRHGYLSRKCAFEAGARWADEHRDGALKGTAQNGKGTANSEGDGRLEDDGDENTNEAGWQNEN